MVGGPRPSRGCQACRSAKKGCDEKLPSCSRCVRLGRECPRYENGVIFRSMNEASKAKTLKCRTPKRRPLHAIGANVTTATDDSDEHCYPKHGGSIVLHSINPTRADCNLAPNMSTDRLGQAVALLLGDFVEVRDLEKLNFGFNEFISPLYEASRSVCFQEAVKATAFINLANTSSPNDLAISACRAYGNSLRDLRIALADPKRIWHDETLATLNVLRIYEVSIASNGALLRFEETYTVTDDLGRQTPWPGLAKAWQRPKCNSQITRPHPVRVAYRRILVSSH